jgi:hypothetical protein
LNRFNIFCQGKVLESRRCNSRGTGKSKLLKIGESLFQDRACFERLAGASLGVECGAALVLRSGLLDDFMILLQPKV